MKTKLWTYITMMSLFLFAGCSDDVGIENESDIVPQAREEIQLDTRSAEVNAQANNFAIDFIQTYATQRTDRTNYCISPLGVTSVLGMLLNGADGETYTQIQKALGLEGFTNEEINQYIQTIQAGLQEVDNTTTYLNANSLWAKEGISFLPEYVEVNQTYYEAETYENQPFDQTTEEAINRWCDEKTKGHITKFVEPGEINNMIALLLNAIYFKGIWTLPFRESDTKERTFTLADGSEKQVPMMYQEENYTCTQSDGITMVHLPYGNEAYKMSVFYSTNGEKDMDDVLRDLSTDKWEKWNHGMLYKVKLYLPRFTFQTTDDQLVELLETLGIKDAFSGLADFTNMSETPLFFSWFKQITSIEVNEVGTVATAVTGAGLETAMPNPTEPQELVIKFDRPFGFVISEISTGAILFAGKVGDPTAQ